MRPCLNLALKVLMFIFCTSACFSFGDSELGWIVSRANCIENASFTWRQDRPARTGHPLNPMFFYDVFNSDRVGLYRYRYTISYQYDRVTRLVTPTYSTPTRQPVYTWRSAAINHIDGAYPRIAIIWINTCSWVPFPIPEFFKRACFNIPIVYLVWDRFIVTGEHHERIPNSDRYSLRYTIGYDCEAEHTYNTESQL